MKKQSLMLALALVVLISTGCGATHTAPTPAQQPPQQQLDPHKPQPALKTGKAMLPPKGCVDLRKRKGAC